MQKKKHILVLSQYFYPESFRINDMCTEWVKRGYQVTVITGIPNYPQGRFYEGYGYTKKRREIWNGMEIIRIPLIPRGNNALGMVCNYLSFVVSGFFWKIFTRVKADYVFMFEVSPMTQALVGVWYAKKHKIPCYLYVQDLWPESVEVVAGIKNRLIIRPIEKMVAYIYKNCDKIFAVSRSVMKEIIKRDVPKQKVEFLPQYAEEFYRPIDRSEVSGYEILNKDCFKVIFTGNIGQAQGLEILPKVAEKLKDENVRFIIVGDGRNKENFVNEIRKYNVEDMFVMIERQPAERIPKLLACCDAAFVSFKDNALFEKMIPAKLQSYMACAMPIIASASGETERIVLEADCGVVSPIGDIDGLCENLVLMRSMEKSNLRMMGKNAREYCEQHFNKSKLLQQIDRIFN